MTVNREKSTNLWRFRVRYEDAYGMKKRYQSKRFQTKKEAVKAETEFLQSLKVNKSEGPLFSVVASDYIKKSTQNNTEKTRKDKVRVCELYFQPLQDLHIFTITTRQCAELLYSLNEMDGRNGNKLSYKRKQKIRTWLSAIFDHAIKFYGLTKSPMDGVPYFQKSQDEKMKTMRIITPQEFQKLYEAFGDNDEDIRNMIAILYYSGARFSEIKSLTARDFDGASIFIHRQYRDGHWVPLKTETSRRKVYLSSQAIKILKQQKRAHPSGLLFGKHGDNTVRRHFDKALVTAELEPMRIHDLRHSHVAFLLDQGVSMYKISKRLGHADISVTMSVYAHLMDTEEKEIVEALDSLGPPVGPKEILTSRKESIKKDTRESRKPPNF